MRGSEGCLLNLPRNVSRFCESARPAPYASGEMLIGTVFSYTARVLSALSATAKFPANHVWFPHAIGFCASEPTRGRVMRSGNGAVEFCKILPAATNSDLSAAGVLDRHEEDVKMVSVGL